MNVWKCAICDSGLYDRPPSECPNAQWVDTDSHLDAVSDSDSKLDYTMLISAAEKYNVPFHWLSRCLSRFVMREEPLMGVKAALLSMGTLAVVWLAGAQEYLLHKADADKSSPGGYREGSAWRIV